MTKRSENECQKLCAKIMESLKEYSTEEIDNPESVKTEILQLLKTHRAVKLSDYEFGLSRSLAKDHRLIIKEPEDGSKVREYSKAKTSWICSLRTASCKCKSSNLQIVNGIVFAPMNHSEKCETKDYSFVMEIQDLLKQGKVKEAYGLPNRKRKSHHITPLRHQMRLLNDSVADYTSILDDSITENTAATASINSTLSPPILERFDATTTQTSATPTRSIVKQEIKNEENDDCMVIEEPAAKKPKTEEKSTDNEIFEFHHPSTIFLKQACKKFNISNNAVYQNGFNFWKDIAFHNIPTVSKNLQKHSFKSSNIFACLSLLFTGKTNSCFSIQNVISEAFREDPVISAAKTCEEIEEILINNIASDEQIEFIAKFLGCRIGIYYGKALKKYGKWNEKEEEDVVTLILSFVDGYFSVVLNVE